MIILQIFSTKNCTPVDKGGAALGYESYNLSYWVESCLHCCFANYQFNQQLCQNHYFQMFGVLILLQIMVQFVVPFFFMFCLKRICFLFHIYPNTYSKQNKNIPRRNTLQLEFHPFFLCCQPSLQKWSNLKSKLLFVFLIFLPNILSNQFSFTPSGWQKSIKLQNWVCKIRWTS